MSRYVPFTQQRYCCVPTCLQMVMYRLDIPLRSQDELGYALGLTVPEDEAHLFERVHIGPRPSSGWGTQIQNPKYEINKALHSLSLPLKVDVDTDVSSVKDLRAKLRAVQAADGDALVCFNMGKLWDNAPHTGHVTVFDRLDGDDVWLVDSNSPKFRRVDIHRLYDAMHYHGPANMGGIWYVTAG